MFSDHLHGLKSGMAKPNITKVNATVILGMPKKNCMYHGICKIEDEDSDKRNTLRPNQLNAKFWLVSSEFVMSINLDEIPPFVLDFHFGSGYFIVLESVDMPTFINDKLGQTITVQQGVYPVVKYQDRVEVVFKL